MLHPTNVERVNVQLAVAATHESTVAALKFYSQSESHCAFQQTAEYLQQVRQWFDIVNVKSTSVNIRKNDISRKPVTSDNKHGLQILQNFQNVMTTWLERDGKGNKISTDTLKATINTCRGLIGLSNYLLDKHSDKLNYVLLGKIQSDKIESRFGHLRKLAGGNYWASVRQFFEGESIIRAKGLIRLSGYSLTEVRDQMAESSQQRDIEDVKVYEELLQVVLENEEEGGEEEDLTVCTEQAIGHIAGYLARSVLKVHKCESCQGFLVNKEALRSAEVNFKPYDDEDAEQTEMKSFTNYLNRGKLLCPSKTAVSLSTKMCHTYRHIMKNVSTRYLLLGCNNPRQVFQKIVKAMSENDERLALLSCAKGHLFLDKIIDTISKSLFNVFTSNYTKDINSQMHTKRSSGAIMSRISRNQNKDKISKLTGYNIR